MFVYVCLVGVGLSVVSSPLLCGFCIVVVVWRPFSRLRRPFLPPLPSPFLPIVHYEVSEAPAEERGRGKGGDRARSML